MVCISKRYLSMFDALIKGMPFYMVGVLTVMLIIWRGETKTSEDIWKLFGNFLGHAIAFEITVFVLVLIAKFMLMLLGII